IVLAIAALSAVGLILLLLPRFTPRTPRWAEFLVPPRYRHSARRAEAAAEAAAREATAIEPAPARPVVAGVSGVNGATAVGARSRFPDRRKAESTR
ncbi:undecaprenyl/decaprenyl-phosphate alpha-N-acetylglucosaminyl 1-phosphate transferase, partial [Streptomyces goshikiensis]